VLYPQNGDRVVTIDSATSLYSMHISWLSLGFQAIDYAIFFGLSDVLATYGSHMATPTDSDCIAKQVCVEPRPSALDMALPAFAAAVDRRDGRTDGRTDTRSLHRPCSTYYAHGGVNKKWGNAVSMGPIYKISYDLS